MAHTLSKVNISNNAIAIITITSYTDGGEQFTATELGLTGAPSAVSMIAVQGQVSDTLPVYEGAGIVKLISQCSQQEIPTAASMSFTFIAMVIG
jgi:hypothetical protein